MRKDKLKKGPIYIVIILAAASVAILSSTVVIYLNSLKAADESLRLQALGIAASLEPSLETENVSKDIFRDIITGASWEGIAFMAIYDKSGMTIMHSNENMVGKRIDSPSVRTSAVEERPVFNTMTLGTGEEVFIVDYPIHARDAVRVLRLALHPYPAQKIIKQARLQAISISIVVIILWITGFFFIKAVIRSDRLSAMMAERERLAVIGEMAAVLAHEIRNPLGSIKGFAQVLREERTGGIGELDVIIGEAGRLERLTEDLLLYARPAAVRVEEFNLSGLIREIVNLPEILAGREKTIEMNLNVPPNIAMTSDREKLKQILINVIQNSVDAIDDGGSIWIDAQRADDKIIIIVRDNGCGMDQETMSMAFNSFFTSKAKGTGLGLAIVDKLAKSLDGLIELESSPEKGTAARITVPAVLHEGNHE